MHQIARNLAQNFPFKQKNDTHGIYTHMCQQLERNSIDNLTMNTGRFKSLIRTSIVFIVRIYTGTIRHLFQYTFCTVEFEA